MIIGGAEELISLKRSVAEMTADLLLKHPNSINITASGKKFQERFSSRGKNMTIMCTLCQVIWNRSFISDLFDR